MKKTNKIYLAVSLCACLAATATPARAAGGHFAVDDAAILETGQCQLETWFDREAGNARRALHVGPACRIGSAEIGLNLDRVRPGDSSGISIMGPQVKWARAVTEQLSIGLAAAANWQSQTPRYVGSTLVVPVTFQMSDPWLVHVNVGRDFRPGQADSSRAGVALEWSPETAWSVTGERYRDGGRNHWRLGGRWNLTHCLSLDLSRAQHLDAGTPAWWTLGLNVVIDR
ncbi:hypothetical protein [Roseateles sp. BYS96W]|uniref:Transporter n=1 Tax=Pelomonas nitida TaxID=3299027 RepID=A0ABW7FZZ8_9BURK